MNHTWVHEWRNEISYQRAKGWKELDGAEVWSDDGAAGMGIQGKGADGVEKEIGKKEMLSNGIEVNGVNGVLKKE